MQATLALLPLLAVTLAALPAQATLISIDIVDPDGVLIPGGATRDTEGGLDWLDLTPTIGLLYSVVAAGAGPGDGWVSDGWRYATTAEVCAFFSALGDVLPNCPGPNFVAVDEISQASADTFVSLLGDSSGGSDVSAGWFRVSETVVGLGCVACFKDPPMAFAWNNSAGPNSAQDSTAGSFLVREVPEPGTAVLLAVGAVIVCTRRRTPPRH